MEVYTLINPVFDVQFIKEMISQSIHEHNLCEVLAPDKKEKPKLIPRKKKKKK